MDIIDREPTRFAQPLNVCDLDKLVMDTENALTRRKIKWAIKQISRRHKKSLEPLLILTSFFICIQSIIVPQDMLLSTRHFLI